MSFKVISSNKPTLGTKLVLRVSNHDLETYLMSIYLAVVQNFYANKKFQIKVFKSKFLNGVFQNYFKQI